MFCLNIDALHLLFSSQSCPEKHPYPTAAPYSAYETITADAAKRGIAISGVVNNAGILKVSSVENHDLDSFQQLYQVNVYGVLRLTQKFLPLLRKVGGRIINISSVAGFMTIPRAAGYCSSKHALEALNDGLRIELSKYNVSVTSVQPGAVQSAIFDKVCVCIVGKRCGEAERDERDDHATTS